MDLTAHHSIVTIAQKSGEDFLRTKTIPFDFSQYSKEEISALVLHMKKMMRLAHGIGLSANQIGLPWRVFVAEIQDTNGNMKFYSVFNPIVERVSDARVAFEEGCLSVPRKFGPVERPREIIIRCHNKFGKPLKIKAWGMLARVFQHEIDHLDGALFIDKASHTRDTN
jgi:peptide deformylase